MLSQGGQTVQVNLIKKLPREVKSGKVEFIQDGVSKEHVEWDKISCQTIKLITPAAEAGLAVLKVTTETGQFLGEAIYVYVDEEREAIKLLVRNPKIFSENSDLMQSLMRQLVKDPTMQKILLDIVSQDIGMNENNSTACTENLGSRIQANCSKALEVLLRLVYIAAEEDAHQFIHTIYSTSAGKTLVGSYKDRLSLPEDVARAKGHIELAEYLQDVNKRFSDENDDDGESKSIDWQELIQEVNRMQRQSSESEDKKDLKSMPSPEDGDSSDYFADAETSSCGSFEGDPKWADSEAPCTKEHAYLYGCPRTYSAFVKRCHANLAEEDYVPASVIAIQNDQAVAAACTKNKEPSGNEYKFGIPLVEGFHVNLAEEDFVLTTPYWRASYSVFP